jgi:hypothetical protein
MIRTQIGNILDQKCGLWFCHCWTLGFQLTAQLMVVISDWKYAYHKQKQDEVMWDFKFSRRRVWSSESSWIYCHVLNWMLTDVSEVCAASIIRAILMMVAACTSETSVDIQLRTWQYIREVSELQDEVMFMTCVSRLRQNYNMLVLVFCIVKSCVLVGRYQCFGGTCCLYLQATLKRVL